MTDTVSFWATNAGVPIAAYLINFFVRLRKGFPVTAAADWALLLFVLDLVALISVGDFSAYVPLAMKGFAAVLFAGLMLSGLAIWLLNVLWGEGVLEAAQQSGWTLTAAGYVVLSISLTMAYVFAHLFVFSGGANA